MRIAQSETRDKFPLNPKKVLKKTVMDTLVWAILLLIIWGVLAFALSSSTETESWFGIATIGIFWFIVSYNFDCLSLSALVLRGLFLRFNTRLYRD